jgi:hypothetical protein
MAKSFAEKSVVPNSSSGGEDEEENADEEESEQSIEVQSIASAAITSTDAMLSKFTEMTRHFAKMMEQHRKEQLMAKKKNCSIFVIIRFASSSAENANIADSFNAGKKCGPNH